MILSSFVDVSRWVAKAQARVGLRSLWISLSAQQTTANLDGTLGNLRVCVCVFVWVCMRRQRNSHHRVDTLVLCVWVHMRRQRNRATKSTLSPLSGGCKWPAGILPSDGAL